MLKIKDNVNLKELKKFGFKFQKNSYIKILTKKNKIEYIPEIICEIYSDKSSYPRRINLSSGGIEVEHTDIFYDTFDSELDVIYDLIKANLVEKVEEK